MPKSVKAYLWDDLLEASKEASSKLADPVKYIGFYVRTRNDEHWHYAAELKEDGTIAIKKEPKDARTP